MIPRTAAPGSGTTVAGRWTVWFARGFWVLIVALSIAAGVLILRDAAAYPLGLGDDFHPAGDLILALVAPVYGSVGALIVSRRTNAIGWLFCVMASGQALLSFGTAYAFHGLATVPGSLPGTGLAAWLGKWTVVPAIAPVLLVFLLFPDGRPPTRRWRPVGWIAVASMVAFALKLMLEPGAMDGPWSQVGVVIANPVGVPVSLPAIPAIGTVGLLGSSIASALAVIVRYRRSRGEERQQLRWMAFVPATTLAYIAVAIVILNLFKETAASDLIGGGLWGILPLFIFIGVPIAAGISVLRYRLYDLDIVVKKTVVFGLLTATLTVVYLLIAIAIPTLVLGVQTGGGRGSGIPSMIGALIVALAFQPLRSRARRLADRIVYGERASPYDVLSEFSERMSETYSIDDVLPRMAQVVAASTGAKTARVWLRVGPDLRVGASWPVDSDRPASLRCKGGEELPSFPEDETAFPVRHQGEILGALTATMHANDPLTPAQGKLLQDLASQAGLMLRNVGLIQELRASRHRIVTAQDERAKALERNLHDGAQQQLVALSVKLGLLEQTAARDPGGVGALATELRADANDALENLRDLARGIYPPLLADRGLADALDAQARKSAVPTVVEADGIGRYAPEIEATVYFCCLEALQNVAKYSGASSVALRLSATDAALRFEVADDGRGFDPASTDYGTGLQGMADRLDAIGGAFEIMSELGVGTTVVGRITVIPQESSP